MDFNHDEQANGAAPDFNFEDHYAEVYIESSHGHVLIARAGTGVDIQGSDRVFFGLFQDGN